MLQTSKGSKTRTLPRRLYSLDSCLSFEGWQCNAFYKATVSSKNTHCHAPCRNKNPWRILAEEHSPRISSCRLFVELVHKNTFKNPPLTRRILTDRPKEFFLLLLIWKDTLHSHQQIRAFQNLTENNSLANVYIFYFLQKLHKNS